MSTAVGHGLNGSRAGFGGAGTVAVLFVVEGDALGEGVAMDAENDGGL